MKNSIRILVVLSVISLLLLSLSCEKQKADELPGDPVPINTEPYQKEVIRAANEFAFDLFRPLLVEAKGTENIMISPYSVTSALSMLLNGASGETFNSVRAALRMDDKTLSEINETYLKLMTEMVPVDKRVIMEIANSVWVEKRLIVKQPFITALQTWYKAEARDIDVSDPNAVDMVNNWIAEKTHDKITEMLDQLDPDLAMLLINAIYFNGKWRHQFDKSETYNEDFYVTPSNLKNVPMMHQKENFCYIETPEASIIELPYGQGNYSMVIALPAVTISTGELAAALTPDLWEEWMDDLSVGPKEVNVTMPKFKYRYKRLLNADLANLGMGIIFSDLADFSNISDQSLMVTRVLHETFIETDEEGTEAAAATVVEVCLTSVTPVNEMNLNRPFLYFIRETSTGTIVFMGRVGDPTVG
ncbi:MAG TPA: serpin family protein [Bacteroidales bacterium]|nr:serpin family protein [Bacteroidales bacterium]